MMRRDGKETRTTATLPKRRTAIARIAPACLIMALAGCAGLTLTEMAPPAEAIQAVQPEELSALSHGRQIYLTRCARCHSAQPVRQYTPRQWNALLPGMIRQTKLDASQESDLRAYITAVLKSETNP